MRITALPATFHRASNNRPPREPPRPGVRRRTPRAKRPYAVRKPTRLLTPAVSYVLNEYRRLTVRAARAYARGDCAAGGAAGSPCAWGQRSSAAERALHKR